MSKQKDAPAQLVFAGVVEPEIDPAEHWKGMPEYTQENLKPFHQITVSFASADDVRAFADLVGQSSAVTSGHIWYPGRERRDLLSWVYVVTDDVA